MRENVTKGDWMMATEEHVEVTCPRCHGRPWEPHTWHDPKAPAGGCKRCHGTGLVTRKKPARKPRPQSGN